MPERVSPQPTSTAARSSTPARPARCHAGAGGGSGARSGGSAGAGRAGATGRSVTVDMEPESARTVRGAWGPPGNFLRSALVPLGRVADRHVPPLDLDALDANCAT